MSKYIDEVQLREYLLFKRIVKWDEDRLVLEDGIVVTLETSEYDCCAGAYGTFKEVELDAVITDVKVGEMVDVPDDDTRIRRNTITLFHNQNPIALAEMTADAGNGGYYYSIGSMVIKDLHFPFVDA
ncbi:hypothetical protein KBI51_09490 [Aerococcaceae bacterium zg-ZUI334]|uniref:DUF7448 domain-containing protein n=1 Tax=Aerococcaceae bacterium zg-252 TaxID=2796928 RepID=UPI001B8E6E07|nr:hypothetical protein [Aerococcaceae bacterium zg-ZUI334]